jgi:hypothetical protein
MKKKSKYDEIDEPFCGQVEYLIIADPSEMRRKLREEASATSYPDCKAP